MSKVGEFNIAKTIASTNFSSSSSGGRNNISPHVDTVGNLPSARKFIVGFASKPLGGSWRHPQKNCMKSSKLHPFAVDEKTKFKFIYFYELFLLENNFSFFNYDTMCQHVLLMYQRNYLGDKQDSDVMRVRYRTLNST